MRTLVRRRGGAVDLDVEIPEVVFVGHCADAGDSVAGTYQKDALHSRGKKGAPYGSAISRSVSLTIRLGSAMVNPKGPED